MVEIARDDALYIRDINADSMCIMSTDALTTSEPRAFQRVCRRPTLPALLRGKQNQKVHKLALPPVRMQLARWASQQEIRSGELIISRPSPL